MVSAHVVGEHLFDVVHHGIIFGAGIVAGLTGVAWMVVKRVK